MLPAGADVALRKLNLEESFSRLPETLADENAGPLFGLAYGRFSFIGLLFLGTEMKEAELNTTTDENERSRSRKLEQW